MRVRQAVLLFLCAVALAQFALAQGAVWQPVPLRMSWDQSMVQVCANASQCLLHIQGSPNYDGDLQRWFAYTQPSSWPKCVNNSQFILDYACESGNWSTRTKVVALWLLKHADSVSPDNFTLYCGSYQRVLNEYRYLLQGVVAESYLGQYCSVLGKAVPCVNSVCVLKTPSLVAVGTSLNVPVNDASKSFLKALNKSVSLCSGVSATSSVFQSCGEGVWYNPAVQGVIYLPSGALSPPTAVTGAEISGPMGFMSSYVMGVLHNPSNPGMNFDYFPKARLFNNVYAAQNSNRAVFGFLEEAIRPETDPIPLDFIGVRYAGIDLGANPCLNIVKVADARAFCENQSASGFNIIARHRPTPLGASPIVGLWPALTGKLRP